MKTYKCICEALDYGKNPNAIKDLKEILGSVDGVTIKEEFYEPGTVEEGAGAGIIVEVSEDVYSAASRKIRKITSEKYGVDEYSFRLGLGIIAEV